MLSSALADPSTDTAPATPAAPNAAPAAAATPDAAAAAQAAAKAAAEKAEIDRDTQHFLAEGYKPEMHGGEQVYCRRETALGSRLAPVKNCGTIEQLKLSEQETKNGLRDTQRQQVGISTH
ncbi:MAG TPA: hypothetical protein VNV40_01900 [Steroidobacteraceae bacterium]|nr:hypothetical protein [Steroidobacteraceae bacterium]